MRRNIFLGLMIIVGLFLSYTNVKADTIKKGTLSLGGSSNFFFEVAKNDDYEHDIGLSISFMFEPP